ncbi:MAG: hypothetical protein LBV67_01435 [Streptococcaceae bacterium]|jgi:hypothetical protein|nr:hypothetical protein [Streptococcaceae bacterium]
MISKISFIKEMKIFKNGSYKYFVIVPYIYFLLMNVSDLKTSVLITILTSLMFNDALTMNSIGIELQELIFLKKEGINIEKILKKKFIIWFLIGLIMYIFLILKQLLPLPHLELLPILNLLFFFILNYLFIFRLSLINAVEKNGYYKVRPVAQLVMVLFIILITPIFFFNISSIWLSLGAVFINGFLGFNLANQTNWSVSI